MTRWWYAIALFTLLSFVAVLATACDGSVEPVPLGGQVWQLDGVGPVLVTNGCDIDYGSFDTIEYRDLDAPEGSRLFRGQCKAFLQYATRADLVGTASVEEGW